MSNTNNSPKVPYPEVIAYKIFEKILSEVFVISGDKKIDSQIPAKCFTYTTTFMSRILSITNIQRDTDNGSDVTNNLEWADVPQPASTLNERDEFYFANYKKEDIKNTINEGVENNWDTAVITLRTGVKLKRDVQYEAKPYVIKEEIKPNDEKIKAIKGNEIANNFPSYDIDNFNGQRKEMSSSEGLKLKNEYEKNYNMFKGQVVQEKTDKTMGKNRNYLKPVQAINMDKNTFDNTGKIIPLRSLSPEQFISDFNCSASSLKMVKQIENKQINYDPVIAKNENTGQHNNGIKYINYKKNGFKNGSMCQPSGDNYHMIGPSPGVILRNPLINVSKESKMDYVKVYNKYSLEDYEKGGKISQLVNYDLLKKNGVSDKHKNNNAFESKNNVDDKNNPGINPNNEFDGHTQNKNSPKKERRSGNIPNSHNSEDIKKELQGNTRKDNTGKPEPFTSNNIIDSIFNSINYNNSNSLFFNQTKNVSGNSQMSNGSSLTKTKYMTKSQSEAHGKLNPKVTTNVKSRIGDFEDLDDLPLLSNKGSSTNLFSPKNAYKQYKKNSKLMNEEGRLDTVNIFNAQLIKDKKQWGNQNGENTILRKKMTFSPKKGKEIKGIKSFRIKYDRASENKKLGVG